MTVERLEFLRDSLTVLADQPHTDSTSLHVTLADLPASQWRSLGKRFDYRDWEARDRFLELDAAILIRHEIQMRSMLGGSSVQIESEVVVWEDSLVGAA